MMKCICTGMIFLVIFFISCNNNKPSVPNGVIGIEKMTSVLGDMMMADEYATNFLVLDSAIHRKEENAKLYEQVFAIHGTNKEQFVKSYKYYEGEPIILKIIYDSLYNRLNRLRNGYYPRQAGRKITQHQDTGVLKIKE